VVDATVRRRVRELLATEVIPHPDLVGRNSQMMRADVDHALQEPEMLHARISAIRADRTLVGHRLCEVNARTLEPINSRKYLRPNHAAERLIWRIGSAIVDMARRNSRDHAILVQSNPRVPKGALVAVRARCHVLGPGLHPLDRAASGFLRGQRTYRHLRIAGDLDSEAAADVGCLDANLVYVDVQMRGKKLNCK